MRLTEAQRAFLDRPLHAIVATTRPDGSAAQSTVWYLRDGDEIWISTSPDSVKVRHLHRDPRISVLILSEDGGRWLALAGTATITEDVQTPDRIDLMRRYLGEEGARQMVQRRPLSKPNARVRVHPLRVTSYNFGS